MTRIEDGLIRQCEDFFTYACEKRRFITDRQVRASDTMIKNEISAKCQTLLRQVISDMAAGVSGGVQNVNADITQEKRRFITQN